MMISEHPNRNLRIAPARMAHFVIRTNRFEETLRWYERFFLADTVYSKNNLAFLSFDDEHHRIAIGDLNGLGDSVESASAIDHVAFSFDSLHDLMYNYERLRDDGIAPIYAINHGPTTSIYYADPNGCKIELQVDNYPTSAEARDFFFSQAFHDNPIGVFFDPEALLAKFKAGEPVEELLKQGSVPAVKPDL
ncbi:VOC family protein [Sphingobium chlorophenolicum]|nr:VOC family protein [Sphingobium chlorophenolicum]